MTSIRELQMHFNVETTLQIEVYTISNAERKSVSIGLIHIAIFYRLDNVLVLDSDSSEFHLCLQMYFNQKDSIFMIHLSAQIMQISQVQMYVSQILNKTGFD